jgi:hypothetical protein
MKASTKATPTAQKMLADLAAGHRETMRLSDRKVKVARIRITDAGRRALEGDIRGSPWYLVAMIRFDRFQLAAVGGYAMAEVEREDLTAAEFAVLAAIVEMNEKLWCWIDRWHV